MIGLRKVVKLTIYDLPKEKIALNKEKTFGYSYRTRYYIGKEEIFKSRVINHEKRKKLFSKELNDECLSSLIQKIVESPEDLETSFTYDENGLMYFGENGSKIIYYGNRKEELKNKLLSKRK